MKHLKSLREFISLLETIGEVQPINAEIDWNLEIGAITRHSYELRAPAPLFKRIKGIDAGYRMLGVPATSEIVIEGHISHTEVEREGPMGEYPGYLDKSQASRNRPCT